MMSGTWQCKHVLRVLTNARCLPNTRSEASWVVQPCSSRAAPGTAGRRVYNTCTMHKLSWTTARRKNCRAQRGGTRCMTACDNNTAAPPWIDRLCERRWARCKRLLRKFHECLKQRAGLHFVHNIINHNNDIAYDIALTHRETIDLLPSTTSNGPSATRCALHRSTSVAQRS